MSIIKPSLPKGTRDFGPEQSAKRAYIIDKIKECFKHYGFRELSTPALENLSTLTGKYGNEGDQLLFKILNSGDFMSKVPASDPADSVSLTPHISEKGLRYDLTVPFARYVVSNQNDITYPFKRFQIQPVWRADRPQKGRYREFYQCDADIIGSRSEWNEAELTLLIHDVFKSLGLTEFVLKVNHREVLAAFARYLGLSGQESAFCVELDKLDKIGSEKVRENLEVLGAGEEELDRFMSLIANPVSISKTVERLDKDFEIVNENLNRYFQLLTEREGKLKVELDLSLARGLTYYTGMIFEVKPTTVQMGSICGGGRYDDLTGIFGLKDVSGVGISFGLDRIYDVMDELDLFPKALSESIEVFIVHFDEESFLYGLEVLSELRGNGISSDIYPDLVKIKKQFNYADRTNARNVVIIGSEERASGQVKLRNMKTGQEELLTLSELIKSFKDES